MLCEERGGERVRGEGRGGSEMRGEREGECVNIMHVIPSLLRML